MEPVIGQPNLQVVTKSPRKSKFWLFFTLAVIFILALVGLFFYYMPIVLTKLSPDTKVVQDEAALVLTSINVPDAENGIFALDNITPERIYRPIGVTNFEDTYTNHKNPVQWDQLLVDDVLYKNQLVLALITEAVSKKFVQDTKYADPKNINFKEPEYSLASWLYVSKLQAVKSLSLSRAGKDDDAYKEATKLYILGHLLVEGQNGSRLVQAGIEMQQLSLETIIHMLPYGAPSKEVLLQTQGIVNKYKDNVEGYKDAVRFDYAAFANSVDDANKDLASYTAGLISAGVLDSMYLNWVAYGYYFKPNDTKALAVAALEENMQNLALYCGTNPVSAFGEDVKLDKNLRLLFDENILGKTLLKRSVFSYSSNIERQCKNDLYAGAAEILLSMRLYKMDKGVLPENVNELIPMYLSVAPVDPYSKQPIDYTAYSRALNSPSRDTPTFKIEF